MLQDNEYKSIFAICKNVKLTNQIKSQLDQYYKLLVGENQKYNLTRIIDEKDFYKKHVVDSLLFTNVLKISHEKIADIGSGAGFPGVVLKIFFPNLNVVLIESNNKKVIFLNKLINNLNLKNIQTSDERAEVYSTNHYEEFDFVVSRAVAYLDIILEIGAQMLKVNGQFILLKGPRVNEEIKNSNDSPKKLSLVLKQEQVVDDIDFGKRINLFYEKFDHTNKIYPRKYAVIKKTSGNNVG